MCATQVWSKDARFMHDVMYMQWHCDKILSDHEYRPTYVCNTYEYAYLQR